MTPPRMNSRSLECPKAPATNKSACLAVAADWGSGGTVPIYVEGNDLDPQTAPAKCFCQTVADVFVDQFVVRDGHEYDA